MCIRVQTIDFYTLAVAGSLLHASHFENIQDIHESHFLMLCMDCSILNFVVKWCNLLLTATNLCV